MSNIIYFPNQEVLPPESDVDDDVHNLWLLTHRIQKHQTNGLLGVRIVTHCNETVNGVGALAIIRDAIDHTYRQARKEAEGRKLGWNN